MTNVERLREISFGLFERYVLLERIAGLFRPHQSEYRVLDVGGHTPAFWPGFPSLAGALIPDATAVVVDLVPIGGLRNYIRASGIELPFRDGSFDLVCSLDTLEHIPAEHRAQFLGELLRVTRDGLYLACPFDSENNRWAESVMVEYTGSVLRAPLQALLEHRQYGLPDRESISGIFSQNPHPWIDFVQGNTNVWLLMMLTYHSLRPSGTDFVLELNRRFNQVYAGQDWGEPAYRVGYLLSKCRSAADLETARASFASGGKAVDLQGVLAFCQLFLTIAQNARAAAALESHTSLEQRLRDLESALVSNSRAIHAIYDSRIWKTLSRIGGMLLHLSGRPKPEPADAAPSPEYDAWITRHEPGKEAVHQMRLDIGKLTARPRISIAVPVYKTSVALLSRCIESVVSQVYPDWELCLADDGSDDASLAAVLRKYAESDSRIGVTALKRNRGIAGATNTALKLCSGEYVAFLDHDDELAPFALYDIVRAIQDCPDTDLFYSDEDKIDERGRRYDAFFKPDWSPELFHSCNYICHFVVMKRSLVDRLGGLNENYSGSQDYEFLLRATELTQKIRRIPKVLYHWRAATGSVAKAYWEKPEASADGHRALSSFLERNSPGAHIVEVGPCRYRVRYAIREAPRVSILMPTGGHKGVFRAIEDVLDKTEYKNYEIVLIDNSPATSVAEYAARLTARKAPVRYFDWRGQPFNFSRMNNAAVRATDSPHILFLNDDTSIISAEWLTAMLEHAQRPDVGAVGAQLWYPNNLIQHAGVVMGLYGNCSHAFKNVPANLPHYYFDLANLTRNCSAVTGACLLVAREKFLQAGAFDEVNLAVAFQDVDLCLKLLELGYRNVYTPYARLYHHESATKTEKDKIPDPMEDAFMKKKWAKYIADDPYYNPNLTRRAEDFSLSTD
ncbi:MAG TPA: glycosyltransferase [Bryobacteraceae bacterium]|nr:glycosyltransferase [Bryobacteraceae bacterium]